MEKMIPVELETAIKKAQLIKKVKRYEVDMSLVLTSAMIVKVPKYISEEWQRLGADVDIATLLFDNKSGEAFVSLPVEQNVENIADLKSSELMVDVSPLHHAVGIFSYPATDPTPNKGKLVHVEGHSKRKFTFRPRADRSYLNMKQDNLRKEVEAYRTARFVDGFVQNFKPVARHSFDIANKAIKANQVKHVRSNREVVKDMLFNAFEKHQYYNFKDLVDLTKQPVPYLKEVLNEIGTFNKKGFRKCMWELREEYRYYSAPGEDAKKTE